MRHGKPQNTPSPRIETAYETKQRQRKEAQELAQKHQTSGKIKYLLKWFEWM